MSAPRVRKRLCARGAWLGASARPLNFTVRWRPGRFVLMRSHWVLAALFISTASVTGSSGGNTSSSKGDDASSLIGTWRLVLADYRPDKNSRWKHAYGEHTKGYFVYDKTSHVSI